MGSRIRTSLFFAWNSPAVQAKKLNPVSLHVTMYIMHLLPLAQRSSAGAHSCRRGCARGLCQLERAPLGVPDSL